LVDFAVESSLDPAIFFTSSIGVVKNQPTNASVPEALITDFTLADGGYGSSKLIAELILDKASSTSGVKCTICRLGQIAGPVDMHSGMWTRQEWLPSVSNSIY
jgi:nucleoside-diphosphate-sugar epimerase